MLIATTLALTVSLAAQFAEGAAVSSPGCFSLITQSTTTIVSSNVGTFRNNANQQPKQGETFFVYINILAMPQPCATTLYVRPGFKLPPGVDFVPVPQTGGFNAPVARCFMGPAGGTLAAQPCMLEPTEILADGTLIFDRPNGTWQIPDGHILQIKIPVRGEPYQSTTLSGYVDFAAFDAQRPPLSPTVPMQVFYNAPSIAYPSPAVDDIGPYEAHVYGYVDPHFNAGTVRLEVKEGNGPFVVVDATQMTSAQFEANVDLVIENLEPDTDYQFRWTYQEIGQAFVNQGAAQSFRTDPAPRFAFTQSVTGEGSILKSPAPLADGSYEDRTVVTFTATPDAGWRLVSLRLNGSPVGGNAVTVTVSAALTVSATFEELPSAPPPSEGEGEGEGEPPVAGEGEGEPVVDEPVVGEGEGEPVAGEGEGEGAPGAGFGPVDTDDSNDDGPRSRRDRDDDDDDDDAQGGCAATAPAGVPVALVALLFFSRRRRVTL